MKPILLYDSTLRDGTQGEGVSLSLEDKLAIAAKLDDVGVDCIEGGYPLSNPKDLAFFQQAAARAWRHARIVAFGMTRRARLKVEDDPGMAALLEARTPVVTVVGKSWDIHVTDVLRVSLDQNLEMIADTVRYLKSKGLEVFYDAEHFFDGHKANPEYARKTVAAAVEAGATHVVLCDTNGGSLPGEVGTITADVLKRTSAVVGFHGHNDGGLAVANTLAAVEAGAEHVQGTVNGLGERAGNADLCAVVANLVLKLKRDCAMKANLKRLTELSRYVYEVANMPMPGNQPFVGRSAFAHKGGMHIHAVLRNPITYEHIRPEQVGNEHRILMSELGGVAGVEATATPTEPTLASTMEPGPAVSRLLGDWLHTIGIQLDRGLARRIVAAVQERENEGYAYEAAEASYYLLVRRLLCRHRAFFRLEGFRVIVEKRQDGSLITEGTIKVEVESEEELTASEGDGPVNALDGALRKALERFYPCLKDVRLIDYKVRVVNPKAGTAARVRVMIESTDGQEVWGTVGVSENLIQASWEALVDSIEYKLVKELEAKPGDSRESR